MFLSRNLMKIPTLVLLLLVASASYLAADRSQQDPMEGVRYVDMERCLKDWTAFQAQNESMRATYEAMRKQFQSQNDDLESRKAALEEFDPQSPEYMERAFELDIDVKTLQTRVDWAASKLNEENAVLLARGVARIHEAARQLGESKGYSSIQMAPMALPPANANASDQLRDLEGRWILWSNPNYDVTNEVLQILSSGE
jgi:Skp family chaperone for outer membrane proteins